MGKVTLAESAWEDLDSITDYISLDSIRYAREFADRFFERIEILSEFPELGRVVPEFKNEQLRELIMGKYRIVYRIYPPHSVIVLRVIHGSKLME